MSYGKKEDYLKRFYYGRHKMLWSKGYFCATVGEASEETIEKYIDNQG